MNGISTGSVKKLVNEWSIGGTGSMDDIPHNIPFHEDLLPERDLCSGFTDRYVVYTSGEIQKYDLVHKESKYQILLSLYNGVRDMSLEEEEEYTNFIENYFD